jgi:GntR family transcriptional regulator
MASPPPVRDRRPIALRLRDELRALIHSEALRPGDRLPSESELAGRFAVARGSVREALKLLEQDGLVDVHHGLGRFVSAGGDLTVTRPITTFESVTEMLRARGLEPTTRELSRERGAATAAEREALALDDGAEVVRLRRLRVGADGSLLVFSSNVFPAAVLGPDADPDVPGSLGDLLAARGHPLVSSAAEIRAAALPADVATRAEAAGDHHWLLITERCVDDAGRPILLSDDYHRGDVFSFQVLRRRES